MCYECTSIMAEYQVKRPFIRFDYDLCHHCEWEIKELIWKEGSAIMYDERKRKQVKLTKFNIKDIIGYEQWLDKCSQKDSL